MTLGRLRYLPAAALTLPGLQWRNGSRAALGRESTVSQDSHWGTPSLQLIESEMPVMDDDHLCVAHILQGVRQDALLTIGQRAAGCIDGLALTPCAMTARSSSCCDGGVVVLTSAWTTRRSVRYALITAILADEDIHLVLTHLHDADLHLTRNRGALAALSAGHKPYFRRLLGHRSVYHFADLTVEEDARALSTTYLVRFFDTDCALARRVHDGFLSAVGQHSWLSVDDGLPEGCELDGLKIRSAHSGRAARGVIVETIRSALGWESDAFTSLLARRSAGDSNVRHVGVWGSPQRALGRS